MFYLKVYSLKDLLFTLHPIKPKKKPKARERIHVTTLVPHLKHAEALTVDSNNGKTNLLAYWQKHHSLMRTWPVLQNLITRGNHCSMWYTGKFPTCRQIRVCFYKIGIILYTLISHFLKYPVFL